MTCHTDAQVATIVDQHIEFKFRKLANSGISLNWCIFNEITTCNTTAYFLAHSVHAYQ